MEEVLEHWTKAGIRSPLDWLSSRFSCGSKETYADRQEFSSEYFDMPGALPDECFEANMTVAETARKVKTGLTPYGILGPPVSFGDRKVTMEHAERFSLAQSPPFLLQHSTRTSTKIFDCQSCSKGCDVKLRLDENGFRMAGTHGKKMDKTRRDRTAVELQFIQKYMPLRESDKWLEASKVLEKMQQEVPALCSQMGSARYIQPTVSAKKANGCGRHRFAGRDRRSSNRKPEGAIQMVERLGGR